MFLLPFLYLVPFLAQLSTGFLFTAESTLVDASSRREKEARSRQGPQDAYLGQALKWSARSLEHFQFLCFNTVHLPRHPEFASCFISCTSMHLGHNSKLYIESGVE